MRKTAEEILKKQEVHQINIGGVVYEMVKLSQSLKAMREFSSQEVSFAVEKALAMAAKKAKTKTPHDSIGVGSCCNHEYSVDKPSILSLKEQVLKELNIIESK